MYDQKKVKRVAIISIAFVLFIVILSVILMAVTKKPEEEFDGPDGTVELTISFENRYQLDYSIGNYNAATALTQIEETLKKPEELNSAPEENTASDPFSENYYLATIDEVTFKKISKSPEIYKYYIGVSDGRKYTIQTLYEENVFAELSYITTVISRNDEKSNNVYAYTSAEKGTSYYTNAVNWIKSFNLKEEDLTILTNTSE